MEFDVEEEYSSILDPNLSHSIGVAGVAGVAGVVVYY